MTGSMFLEGKGVVQNYDKARLYLEQAVKQESAQGMFLLGYIYDRGLGVEQDYKKAFDFYKAASAFDVAEAFAELSFLYLNGFGVEQDRKEAVKCFNTAQDLGYTGSDKLQVIQSQESRLIKHNQADK